MMTSSSSAISFGPTHPSRMRASGRGESTSLGLAFSSSVRAPPQSIRSIGGKEGEGRRERNGGKGMEKDEEGGRKGEGGRERNGKG
jgi:hypothetical protein